MIRDVVIDKNDNQSDEDNAIDATTPEQRNCQQGGAVTAGHDELIVDREGQECGIRLERFGDFEPDDIIELYEVEKIAQQL